jgi:hypothetical protein
MVTARRFQLGLEPTQGRSLRWGGTDRRGMLHARQLASARQMAANFARLLGAALARGTARRCSARDLRGALVKRTPAAEVN